MNSKHFDPADLIRRLDALERDNAELRVRLEEATSPGGPTPPVATRRERHPGSNGDVGPMSRRRMLTAAAAAGGGLLAAGALDPQRASAAAGNNMVLGQANDAGTSATSLTGGVGGGSAAVALTALNTAEYTAIYGRAQTPSGLSGSSSAVLGDSSTTPGIEGISSSSDGVLGRSSSWVGVHGIGAQYGVKAEGTQGGALIRSTGSGAPGVDARSDGVALFGQSASFQDLWLGGTGRMRQKLTASAGPPADSPVDGYRAGEQVRDSNGVLWLCIVDGAPGTWVRVPTVPSSGAGGAINVLSQPIRIYDTRGGAPFPASVGKLASGSTYALQVTGTTVGGISVPAGAAAVIGTLTVADTGTGGYLSTFPTSTPPSPLTSSINWFAAGQTAAAQVTIGLDNAGKCRIGNGLSGGSTATNVIFDAVAYIA